MLPKSLRLWFKSEIAKETKDYGKGKTRKQYELDMREVSYINASLSDKADVGSAVVLNCNTTPQIAFQGITPGHEAFVLTGMQKQSFNIEEQPVIYPYLVGDEVLSGVTGRRYLLNLGQMSIFEAQKFPAAFSHIKKHVLPARQDAAEKGKDSDGNMRPHHRRFLERWWQLSWGRADMLIALSKVQRYIVCSRVTKRPIFTFVSSNITPGDALQVFALADDYSFGILQSSAHYQWFHIKCTNMKSDPRYTSESVFDTFPWPQDVTDEVIDSIAEAGRKIRYIREQAQKHIQGGLRELYRTLELPGKNPLRDAHSLLDALVLKAYGFSSKQDLLEELLKLNHFISKKTLEGEFVNGPGIPKTYKTPEKIITNDAFGINNNIK